MSLFAVSHDIFLKGIKFMEIDFTDKPMIEDYIKKTSFDTNMWTMNFTYYYTFNESATRKVVWKIIDDMLCIFIVNNNQHMFMLHLPLGECDRRKLNIVTLKCFKLMQKINEEDTKETYIRDISDLHKDMLMQKYFKLNKGSFGNEHHYDVKGVASLAGKPFAYIRHKINKFNKEYPNAIWRPYEDKDWDQMLMLQKAWEDTAGEKYFRIVDATYYRGTLKNYQKLGHQVFVVELDKRIIGMISGAYLTDDHKLAWCYLRKPLNNFDGLSEFVIYKLCCELKEADLLNDGADGGHKGLKFFKQRFSPVQSPAIFICKLRQKKSE
jgi:hypothetical protein